MPLLKTSNFLFVNRRFFFLLVLFSVVSCEPAPKSTQVVSGNIENGEALFNDKARLGCGNCHSLTDDVILVGPSRQGMGRRAETRISTLSAEDYLRLSILDPDAFIVDGFVAGRMRTDYGEVLTQQEIEDLIAYMLNLK